MTGNEPSAAPASPGQVTWIGHASALVDLGGERVLVDPLGRRRCRSVGHYDAILITHAHHDHLNRWTLASLDRGATLVVPRGAKYLVGDLGFREVVEVEPGHHQAVGKLDIVAVETRHDPGRWRKGDGPTCAGYMIQRDGVTVHHSGDVDMSDFDLFNRMGDEFDIDTTLLPIGGILPVWYYRWRRRHLDRGVHIDPDAALDIAARLQARRMVPVHWGTLHLLGPAHQAANRLRHMARLVGDEHRVRVLGNGQTLDLSEAADPTPLLESGVEPAT